MQQLWFTNPRPSVAPSSAAGLQVQGQQSAGLGGSGTHNAWNFKGHCPLKSRHVVPCLSPSSRHALCMTLNQSPASVKAGDLPVLLRSSESGAATGHCSRLRAGDLVSLTCRNEDKCVFLGNRISNHYLQIPLTERESHVHVLAFC